MPLLLHLESIVSDFRHLFNQQNFSLFQAFIVGFMTHSNAGALTHLYQSSGSRTRYWSFPKFLFQGKWNPDGVAVCLLKWIQKVFPNWVYVYDQWHAEKTGTSQYGLHFFRNFSFLKTSRQPIEVPLRTRVWCTWRAV